MGDVYDFYTGNNVSQIRRDLAKVVEAYGRYLGMLPSSAADELRKAKAYVEAQTKAAERAKAELLEAQSDFNRVMNVALDAVGYLEAKTRSESLYVDDEDHCWILPKFRLVPEG